MFRLFRKLFPSNITKIQLNAFFSNLFRCSTLEMQFRLFSGACEGKGGRGRVVFGN